MSKITSSRPYPFPEFSPTSGSMLQTDQPGTVKQRVLLARALYRQPRILILDEGTANLDVATEEVIADLIAQLPITRIVVAHRPALLNRADRVLVVEGGKLKDAKIERPKSEPEMLPA